MGTWTCPRVGRSPLGGRRSGRCATTFYSPQGSLQTKRACPSPLGSSALTANRRRGATFCYYQPCDETGAWQNYYGVYSPVDIKWSMGLCPGISPSALTSSFFQVDGADGHMSLRRDRQCSDPEEHGLVWLWGDITGSALEPIGYSWGPGTDPSGLVGQIVTDFYYAYPTSEGDYAAAFWTGNGSGPPFYWQDPGAQFLPLYGAYTTIAVPVASNWRGLSGPNRDPDCGSFPGDDGHPIALGSQAMGPFNGTLTGISIGRKKYIGMVLGFPDNRREHRRRIGAL